VGGHVARLGDTRNLCHILAGNPGEKRPLGRHMPRRWDNIRKDLREVGRTLLTGYNYFRIGTSGELLWTS